MSAFSPLLPDVVVAPHVGQVHVRVDLDFDEIGRSGSRM
jgi:hypothetical protein